MTSRIQIVTPEVVVPPVAVVDISPHKSTLEEAYKILYVALKERNANSNKLDGKYYVWADGHSKQVTRGRPPNKAIVVEFQHNA
jgi:hypothetical protein